MQEEAQLFGPSVPDELRVEWALSTPAMSKIVEDGSWTLSRTAQILAETLHLPPSRCTYSACSTVRAATLFISVTLPVRASPQFFCMTLPV